jgi:hypothetical protein
LFNSSTARQNISKSEYDIRSTSHGAMWKW